MTKNIKQIVFSIIFLIFINSFVFSATYTTDKPAGAFTGPIYKDDSLTKPLPSNTWWSSLLFGEFSENMFAFPMNYKATNTGLILGVNDERTTNTSTEIVYAFKEHIKVGAVATTFSNAKVLDFTDWSVTAKFGITNNFTATMGQGFIFTYFEYNSLTPKITASQDMTFYDASGSVITGIQSNISKFTIKTSDNHYFGVFLPDSSNVVLSAQEVVITLGGGSKYMSIGAMTATSDLSTFANYAYNRITNTEVSWSVNSTNQEITTTYSITTHNNGDTIIVLLPHQYNNGALSNMSQTFSSIRGTLKLTHTKSFETELQFNGIVPFLGNPFSEVNATLNTYLNAETDTYLFPNGNMYTRSKYSAMAANLIKVADLNGNNEKRDALILSLQVFLNDCMNTDGGIYFYYNDTIDSMISYPHSSGYERFYEEKLNDHHFHYGYFIYASAILAYYDGAFKTGYDSMIQLLIRDIASTDRSDEMFPFLRYMEIYEGHSIANGMGISDGWQSIYGPDQESSSEAMNAWASIYLWGLMTDNQDLIELGMWGYATEYSAIEEYWMNKNGIYTWNKKSVGRVFGNRVDFDTWFGSADYQIYGIQMLPINPTSLYLSYDTDYQRENYEPFAKTEWHELFYLYRSMYDYTNFSVDYDLSYTETTKSFLYYWNEHFKKYGKYVGNNYTCNKPGFAVFDTGDKITYILFNYENTDQDFVVTNNSNGLSKTFNVSANSLAVEIPDTYNSATMSVCDGLSSDVAYTTNTYSASWTIPTPLPDGTNISFYEYSVNKSTDYSRINSWTKTNPTTSVSITEIKDVITNLTNGEKFYFFIRFYLDDGRMSKIYESNGAILDETAPVISYVRDGLSDDLSEKNTNTSLSANWDGADPESGIVVYYYYIGTTQGGSDVKTKTSAGTNKSITVSGLSLNDNTMYYFTIEAVNGAGLTTTTSSNGIYINMSKPSYQWLLHGQSGAEQQYTRSSTTLAARWSFIKPTGYEGAMTYEYAISSHVYSSNDAISALALPENAIKVWTNYADSTITLSEFNLKHNTKYYFYVRAKLANGAITLPYRSSGIMVALEEGDPKATLSVKKNNQEATEPFTNGVYTLQLDITGDFDVQKTPVISYKYGSSTETANVNLSGTNKTWKDDSFYISANRDNSKITFELVLLEDVAGGVATSFTNTSSFTIKNTFENTQEQVVKDSSGAGLKIPANVLEQNFQVDIVTKTNEDVVVPNNKITDTELKDFAKTKGIFKDMKIYENGSQKTSFNEELTIYFSYASLDINADKIIDGTNHGVDELSIFYLDETLNKWIALQDVAIDYQAQSLSAQINHLSTFGLLLSNDINTINEFIVYPNPCYTERRNYITIGKLPKDADGLEIIVYDITGKKMIELKTTDIVEDIGGSYINWDLKDKQEREIASGVYIVLLKKGGSIATRKIAILQ